jgi:hypothetical protein
MQTNIQGYKRLAAIQPEHIQLLRHFRHYIHVEELHVLKKKAVCQILSYTVFRRAKTSFLLVRRATIQHTFYKTDLQTKQNLTRLHTCVTQKRAQSAANCTYQIT